MKRMNATLWTVQPLWEGFFSLNGLGKVCCYDEGFAFRDPRGTLGTIAFWTVVGLTLVVSVVFFGDFEGGYNHVLKNVFYFGGASPRLLHQLFPPPTYEPPTDVFFEVTGILHVVPAALAAAALRRLFRTRADVSIVNAAA